MSLRQVIQCDGCLRLDQFWANAIAGAIHRQNLGWTRTEGGGRTPTTHLCPTCSKDPA